MPVPLLAAVNAPDVYAEPYVPSDNVAPLNVNSFAVAFAVYAKFPLIVVLTCSPSLVFVHLLQVYPVLTVAPKVTVAPLI